MKTKPISHFNYSHDLTLTSITTPPSYPSFVMMTVSVVVNDDDGDGDVFNGEDEVVCRR